MKILLIQNRITAIEYFRVLMPHNLLAKEYQVGVDRLTNDEGESGLDTLPDEQLKEYDIIYYLRQISYQQGKVKTTLDRLHKLGLKVILDIDDYWILPKAHCYYELYLKNKTREQVEEALHLVDWAITTTDYFAQTIYELTGKENISVFPNCIDENERQFQKIQIPNHRIRFGWIGGVFHKEDILLMNESFKKLWSFGEFSKHKDRWQICCGGFNKNPEYLIIENVLTNGYAFRNEDADYYKYLMQGTPTMEHYSFDKNYRRLWGRPVNNYAELYNHIDVALIPLINNKFNKCKSELKIIEAGWMGKAVICSDVCSYNEWIIDGENGLLVNDNPMDWYFKIRDLVLHPEKIPILAKNLQETIRENFDINTWNKKRYKLYQQLCPSA